MDTGPVTFSRVRRALYSCFRAAFVCLMLLSVLLCVKPVAQFGRIATCESKAPLGESNGSEEVAAGIDTRPSHRQVGPAGPARKLTRAGIADDGSPQAAPSSPAATHAVAGHRLANGLLAPLLC